MAISQASEPSVRSLIPARIDRLSWAPFHTRMVLALGIAWVLDGLEITIASAIGAVLSDNDTLGLSSGAVGLIATVYLLGEVFGALFFGKLSDQLGRKNLFIVTLGVYLAGNAATALTWGNTSVAISFLFLTRFVAGMGIGGEYAAINSAIDEMMPARYRGRVDIAINGTYWGGAILGTLVQLLLLNTLDHSIAWRLGFLVGPAIGLCIWRLRKNLPESPRWLVIHGREEEAEDNIRIIEDEVRRSGQTLEDVPEERAIEIHPQPPVRFLHLARVLFQQHRKRTILGATLMITQSFLYNAIFFTYTLVLTKVYGISESWAPAFLIAFAVGNLVGPLTLGKLFDTVGRRKMIAGTYLLSGVLLADLGRDVPGRLAQRVHPDAGLVHHLLLRVLRRERGVPDRERDLPDGDPGPGDRPVLRDRAVLRRLRPVVLRPAHRRRDQPHDAHASATSSAPR